MTVWFVAIMSLNTVLIVALYFVVRRRISDDSILAEVTEERRLLARMQKGFASEYKSAQEYINTAQKEINKVAAEVEQEVKMSGKVIAENVENIVAELSDKFNAPLEELALKQGAIERCLLRIQDERSRVNACIKREKLLGLLNHKKSYEDIMRDWESIKMENACTLLSKGMTGAGSRRAFHDSC